MLKLDLDRLNYEAQHQPGSGYYGNRLQAYPCYESLYDKENDFTINKLEDILQTKICDFKTLARKIVLSEIVFCYIYKLFVRLCKSPLPVKIKETIKESFRG